MFIIIQKFNSPTVEVYKFHALINGNTKFNEISFIDIFRRNEFPFKQALSNSFYLPLVPVF